MYALINEVLLGGIEKLFNQSFNFESEKSAVCENGNYCSLIVLKAIESRTESEISIDSL